MNGREFTRRGLLSLIAAQAGGLVTVASLVGCKEREFTCLPDAKLPEAEFKARNAVEYVERAADATRRCDACQHWQPGADDGCGGCAVLRGPIHPLGTCRIFAQRA